MPAVRVLSDARTSHGPDGAMERALVAVHARGRVGVVLCDHAGGRVASTSAADDMAARGWWQLRGATVSFASSVTQGGWLKALRRLPTSSVFAVYDPLASLVALARCGPVAGIDGTVLLLQPLRHEPNEACTLALRQMFDLTTAEAALALALQRHGELAMAAAETGITLESARTRMKAVYAKTELRRQGDLLRMLDALAALQGD